MKPSIVKTFVLSIALAGCGPSEAPKPEAKAKAPPAAPAAAPAKPTPPPVAAAPKAEPAPAKPTPPPVVAAPKAEPAPAAKAKEKWELLGETKVNLKVDKDRMLVGKKDGKFRELRVTVKDAPIELIEMTITFGNDQQFKPQIKHNFDENSHSKVIDLPGEERNIKHVDFVYKTAKKNEGKATVQLYGR